MADINVEEVLGKLSLAEKIDLLAGTSPLLPPMTTESNH
jgi:hypothetical protein